MLWLAFFGLQLPLYVLLLYSLLSVDAGPLLRLGGPAAAMSLMGCVVGALAYRLTGPLNT